MDNYIFKLIANPSKLNNTNLYDDSNDNDYLLIELKKKFNQYDIDNDIYNKILEKIENTLIENCIHKILQSIIEDIDG